MTDENIDYLRVEDLLDIAEGIVTNVAIRDYGALAAAAARPASTVFGQDAYPRFEDKAAALLHSLVRNHLLVDGNKRLAWSAMRVFCLMNGRALSYSIDEAEHMMLKAAAGHLDVVETSQWLVAHLTN